MAVPGYSLLFCTAASRLMGQPAYAQLIVARDMCRLILDARRHHCVCAMSIYETMSMAIATVIASCPERSVPTGGEHELETPPPAWSLAMSLYAKVQQHHHIASAHLIVACRQLRLPCADAYRIGEAS